MTQLKNAVLLFLSCMLLYSLSGCSSGSTVITPNGFLYVANSFRPGSVSGFTVTTGALAPNTPGFLFQTGGNAPYTLAAVSTKFVYAGIPKTGGVINRVLNRPVGGAVNGGILLMPINSDHTLGTAQMFAAGGDYDPIAVTPDGKFLYALDITANVLAAFSIDSQGKLTANGSQGPPQVGPDAFNVVIDPQGKFVFVANCDCVTNPQGLGSVSVFSIGGDGKLTPVPGSPFHLGVAAASARPIAMAVSSDNSFLFVASLADTPGAADEVYVEKITNGVLSDAVTGAASVPLPVGSTPVSIALSTDGGNSVYTGNAGSHTLSFFLNCTQTTLPMIATGSTKCPDDRSVPLVLQPTGGASVGGPVGVVLPDPTSTPASTVGSITTPATAPGHFLYATDYDHGIIAVFFVTSTSSCTSSSCPTTPGTLTQSGSFVNTAGVNPFGLAFAH